MSKLMIVLSRLTLGMFNWVIAMLLPASRGRNDCPIHIAKLLGTSQQAAKEQI